MRCMHLFSLLATTAAALPSWIPKRSSSTRFAWAFATHDTVDALVASPSRDEVYAGSHDGNIYAINASTGHLLWNQVRGPVKALAIDAGGESLYAGLEYGIVGLSVTRLPWNFTAGAVVYSVAVSPLGDTVYAGSVDKNVYALRASDGQVIWNVSAGGWVISVAASPSGDTVYEGSADNNVYALRASDGHQLWTFTAGREVMSVAASPSGDTVYAGSYDKHVYALRASDGDQLWNFTAGGEVMSVAASPSGHTVYAGSVDKHVYALRASDGRQLWNFTAGGWVTSVAASPSGETVYAGSWDKNVYALRASDGYQLWNFTADGGVPMSVTASSSGDTVYAGSNDTKVYALRASDGHLLWNFTTGDLVYSVARSPSGGMLYVGAGSVVLAANVHLPNGMVLRWRSDVGALMLSEHLDRLYAASGDGEICALSPDGVWRSIRKGLYLDSLSVDHEGAPAYAASANSM